MKIKDKELKIILTEKQFKNPIMKHLIKKTIKVEVVSEKDFNQAIEEFGCQKKDSNIH